ncbi:MAG: pentapeptide repeat-containing protein [Nostocaceae cyanobacterium]|nr:pentapeptide repeat-containing protein [Nostocaceae cyanobacterium]
MILNIRRWLTEHNIELAKLNGFPKGQIAGLSFRIVQDMEVKSLMPLDICTLAEVLELPLGIVWQELEIIAQVTESLLRSLSNKKPLKRNEGTWLAIQIAYLQSLHQVLEQEFRLQRPWLDRAMIMAPLQIDLGKVGKFTLEDTHLQGLLKTLRPIKLSDTQAEQALSVVTDSFLVQQINNACVAWLVANGAEEAQAKHLVQRLGHALEGHLLMVVADNAPQLAQLQKFVNLGNSLPSGLVNHDTLTPEPAEVQKPTITDKCDLYRENYRASLITSLSEPLFYEFFSLRDIYIPLKALAVPQSNAAGSQKTPPAVDLMTWATEQLTDLETITIITADAGYGKTSFCQIWAAKIAQEVYPSWMPILITLKDITYGKTLEETLDSAFQTHFQSSFSDWLEIDHPPCILILDGLDELPPYPQGKAGKGIFIQQLLRFHWQSINDLGQRRHKIFLTSSNQTWREIAPEIPNKFRQVTIQPLGQEEIKLWFQQWTKVQSLAIAHNLFTFLKTAGVFSAKSPLVELSTCVREPLMLYLLAILHRDGLLDEEILQLADVQPESVEYEIYYSISRWLLGYPRTGGTKTLLFKDGSAHIHRTQEAIANLLQGRHPQNLLLQMQQVALQILHSGRQSIPLPENLNHNSLPAFYFRTQQPPRGHGGNWSTFASHSGLRIEFSHLKLAEYLCAESLATQLKFLTQRLLDAYGELTFTLESPKLVAEHLYKLLGYGILTPKIEELVIERLRREQKRNPEDFSFTVLFQRLEPFWRAYCRGRWLDEGIVHDARVHFQSLDNPLNTLQIDALVGLNVFLLLCACHREARVSFLPCGNPARLTEFYPEALLALIARTTLISSTAFVDRMRSTALINLNLSRASLPQVMLADANLVQTNLSAAELTGANLAGANLTGANLAGANLSGANLTGANLIGANLLGANLTGANLLGVNLNLVTLTNACLARAIINDADKEIAQMNGALFSVEEFQSLRIALATQSHTSQDISSTQPTTISRHSYSTARGIESVEGELDLPTNIYVDNSEDTTVSPANLNS